MRQLPVFILCTILIFSLFACSSKPDPAPTAHTPPRINPAFPDSQHPATIDNSISRPRKIIVSYTLKNLGSPYRWGGTSPKTGFDCSGLIVYTHKMAGVKTPRTSRSLYKSGRPVSLRNLKPADLVFFKIPERNKSLHVGIYIGDGLFVHAPGKNRQVTYARLDNPYFQENFLGSRTFL